MNTNKTLVPGPAWSSVRGHNSVGPMQPSNDKSGGLNRLLVMERLYRYGWAVDERRDDLLADCFTENAVWDAVSMGVDEIGPFTGREAVVKFLTGFQSVEDDQRRHIFTNVLVDGLTTTSAVVHAYFMLTASRNAFMTPVTVGPYRVQMLKQEDVWRIEHMTGGFDSSMGPGHGPGDS